MDEEKMGVSGIESAEECDSVLKLGESSVGVGGEEGDTSAAEEDKPVAAGGEAGDGEENHAAVELVNTPEIVAAGGGGEVIASEGGESSLVMQEEGAERVDDAEREVVVAEGGEATVSEESLVNKDGDAPIIEHELEVKTEEEIDPVVDAELKTDATDPEMLVYTGRDELLVDPQQETKVDPKTEVVDTDGCYEQQLSEFPTDAGGGGLDLVMEGTKECKDEHDEKELGEEENAGALGGVENVPVEIQNNTESAEEKGDFMIDDLQDGKAEDLTMVEKEKGDSGIIADSSMSEVEIDGNSYPVNVSEHEQAHELNHVMEDASVDERNEHVEDKLLVSGESQIHGTKTVDDNNTNMDVSSDVKSDHHLSEAEYKEDGLVKADLPVGDIKLEEEFGVESEAKGDDVVEHLSEDAELETELGTNSIDSNQKEEFGVESETKGDDVVLHIPEDAELETELGTNSIDSNQKEELGVESEMKGDDVVEHLSEDAEIETELGTNSINSKTPDDDGKLETEDTISDVDEPGNDMYDSPGTLQDEEDETIVAEENGTQDTEMETETEMTELGKTSGGKRKKAKLSKSPSITKTRGKTSRKTVGEDVCFICFDGGKLVLCDRRGCPKAYHPSCVNRDEAFFKSKGRWNCGWHMCSICEKNARYMCYTCTFSLCRSCTKDAVILCVRGNKGFCETCMRTVQLIEKKEQADTDAQIDFDDRSSWEYLFKDYYIDLKAKLSLTSVEIVEAKNPGKRSDISGSSKTESPEVQADANNGGSGSDDSIENLEAIRPKRRKVTQQSKSQSKKQKPDDSGDNTLALSDDSEWASRELLEFVSHMKDGDRSVLSQFDVQALLLDYIKRNKLRDPRRKSQIVCDARLRNLFGKPRVGHFEMLKLLESHFLTRDEQNDEFQGSVVDTENDPIDIDASTETLTKDVKDKKRKSRKKGYRGPQSNLDDFAAIDMHNIGLIYLRRKLMEDLLEDSETFNEKVIGTFVRIRISGSNQKQDLYRLVQVVGTSKAAEPYKVGKKATDIMVEILNLDKTEIISIDTISNQDFTEDECKRLRQSIKCGLISRLTVGEILDKTMEIQVARVNDWLESETLRLSHLRDRASDLGRRKELRECVEKLQLLKTPEERRRRMDDIPEIHADPKMDPGYESDDKDSENEDGRREQFARSRSSSFNKRARGPISPGIDNYAKGSWSSAGKSTPSRNLSGSSHSANSGYVGEIFNESSWNIEGDRSTQESNYIDKPNSATKSESAERPLRTASRSESTSGAVPLPSQGSYSSGVSEPAVKINESEKMWHYQDPAGKVQGPFSVVQLRKWNNTGYFPANLKIWRATEKQDNSILLLDALVGKFPKELPAESTFPTTNVLNSSHTLAGHSVKISEASQSSGPLANSSTDKWSVNESTTLPSPTPKQTNPSLLTVTVQSPSVNGALPSPAVLPDLATLSPTLASVMNSVVQNSNFSPTPHSQQGILVDSAIPQHTKTTPVTEQFIPQIHAHPPAAVQPVITQNPPSDTQVWGTGAQSGQAQGYGWSTSNAQSSGSFPNPVSATGIQPDVWRPTQSSQPNMHSPTTPNPSWSAGPAENNTPIAARPQNPNAGWVPMQTNPNMGWGNTNPNWGPAMQVPPASGNTSSWHPPPGNTGPNMPVMAPGNANPGWGPTPGWVGPPNQVPAPGNGWLPSGGNVQGPGQGNANQGWAPWGGEQGRGGGQFSGQRGGGGGRPWNRQSSFGGGSSGGGGPRFNKADMLCPYNANGRCIKGSRCDYRHN